MKAVVYEGVRTVKVREVPDAALQEPTDALVRITSSALCGTDLHMYDGRTGANPGLVLGHEPLGMVEQVGDAVRTVRPGMRVVIPTHVFCGTCAMCARGLSAACLRARDDGVGAAYGYAGMGPYRGGLADLLRVPWADANCVRLPGEPGDAYEDDFVLLADAFVTGWHAAATLAEVQPGDTVAVFGAGTIGLLSAYSALIRGARVVYSVDCVDARLDKAGEIGAVPIDFRRGDPVAQIRQDRARAGLPIGEEKLGGVDKVIDAVGFQAHDRDNPGQERPDQVIADAARLVNAAGAIGVAGVYPDKDLHPRPGATPAKTWSHRGERSSARASRSGSAAPTTAATPCCCATWWSPAGPGPASSSPTTALSPTPPTCTGTSTAARAGPSKPCCTRDGRPWRGRPASEV